MRYRKFRRPSQFLAVLRAESGEFPVTIRNVTPDGLKVEGLGGIVFPEADVDLLVRNRRLSGKVAWVKEDTAGVRLIDPLPRDIQNMFVRG